jgi:hypothetical protein
MQQIRAQFGSRQTAVNWEQGKDDAGNAFVRMKLTQHDKLGDTTQVTIGSDGTSSASYTNIKGHSKPIDAASALEHIFPRKQQHQHWGAADAVDPSILKHDKETDKDKKVEEKKEEKNVEENKEEKEAEETEAEKLFRLKMKKLKQWQEQD